MCIPQEISTITILAVMYELAKFHLKTQKNALKRTEFQRFAFCVFFETSHRSHRQKIHLIQTQNGNQPCRKRSTKPNKITIASQAALASRPSAPPGRSRALPSMPSSATSEGGGAMHMKILDGIGREAGSGPTQNWIGPNEFRACPR